MPVGACLRAEGASSMRSAPTSADCRQMRRFPSRREDPGMPVGAYQAPTEIAYLACKCQVWQVIPIDQGCPDSPPGFNWANFMATAAGWFA